MAILTSYDLKGKKDSFANWISNLSPTDTFFVSTTGKEQITNTLFQWQTDQLAAADKENAQDEASNSIAAALKSTKVYANKTQILRKSVEVSDTADAISTWGRGKELAYQMEKAGKEIKRDLEAILLSNQKVSNDTSTAPSTSDYPRKGAANQEAKVDIPDADSYGPDVKPTPEAGQRGTKARKTACFRALVGTGDKGGAPDPDTGAIVVVPVKGPVVATKHTILESDLFGLTYQLFIAGSDADTIMFHPSHAAFFSSLMESAPGGGNRFKLIENMDTTLNKYVGSVVDPLGQQYRLVPNRWMSEDYIYIFNPKDWTQMVLREPQKVKLAKRGSTERYMIEMEVGLRHRNPYASGVIVIKDAIDA